MSQVQKFDVGGNPFTPNIEFISGSNAIPVGPNPVTFTIALTSILVSHDLSINEHPASYNLDIVNITKYTKYIVDNASFLSVLNFSGNFVAANSIVATVDSVPLGAVPFNTNNATTIANLATQIATASGVIAATVTGTNQITVQFSGGVHTVNSVVTTGGASQPTATINQSVNAPYSTIQSAINAASTAGGGVVAVKWNVDPYIENLTLQPNVDLVAVSPDARGSSPTGCVIQGTLSLGSAGTVHASGFAIISPAGNSVTVNNGSGLAQLFLNNCTIDNAAGFGFSISSGAGSAQVYLNNTDVVAGLQIGNIGTSGLIQIDGGFLYGGSGVAGFTMGTSAVVIAKDAQIQGSTATFDLTSATAALSLMDVTCVAGAAIINFTAAGTALSHGCVFDTSSGGGFWVAGVGTLTYSDITNIGSAIGIDPTTNQVVSDWKPYSTTGNTSTAIRGTCGFDVTDFTVVDGFVTLTGSTTYYSLTPYIVGSDINSQYATIQDAIDQAVLDGASAATPANIYVKPNASPYVEDLTLSDGINIQCFNTLGNGFNGQIYRQIVLDGSVTLASSGATATISGMKFARTTGNIFDFQEGSLYLSFCTVDVTAGVLFSMTTAGTKALSLENITGNGDATSSFISHDGSAATIDISDQNCTLEFWDNQSILTGPDGTVTWNSIRSSISFPVNSDIANFVWAPYYCAFSTSDNFPVLETGASTLGFFSPVHSTFIDIDDPIIVIGNASFVYDFQFSIWDSPYDISVQNGQVSQASLVLVQGSNSTQCQVFADAKTGFHETYNVTKQAFVNTATTSATNFITIPVNTDSSITISGKISSQSAAFDDITNGSFELGAQNVAGTVSIIGGLTFNRKRTSTGDINAVVVGTDVVIQVIAPTADPYNWASTYEFMQIHTDD